MKGGTGLRLRSFLSDFADNEGLLVCFGDKLRSLRFVIDQNLAALDVLIKAAGLDGLFADFEKARIKRWRQFGAEIGEYRPVFRLNKFFNFAFALNHHPQRNGLHAAGA